MSVWDILNKKGDTTVATIAPNASLVEAVHAMCEQRVGCLMVRDAKSHPVGMVSERDCLRELDADAEGFAAKRVEDVMTRDVICGLPKDSAQYAMHVMTNNRIRHLPVIDEGRVVGLISIGDVIRYLLEEQRTKNRKMHDYLELSGQL